ncbi:hypothetical protein OG453_44285 [Streptomyces sp. NBC_01381]|uniref:hypothetical protein n=1 Tax=Streptomyces sp. NBC_01381 TaxID=2903845 RepID=UPI00225928F1|nr:hypothetical protein [Streptomyces sp. NBC_01381]MCX4673577.1 hypothetical protein [Streptomyces sp. NBC_01381]
MTETVIGLVGLASLALLRLLYQWVGGRIRVQLVRLRQQGTSERVCSLPPGSVLTERRADEELHIQVGPGEDARG